MSELEDPRLEAAAPQPETTDTRNEVETPLVEESASATDKGEERIEDTVQNAETNDMAVPTTKEEVIARLKACVEQEEAADRSVTDMLRTVFYRLHNEETAAAREAFVAAGGDAADFSAATDPLEQEYKDLMNTIKEQRAKAAAELEAERRKNLDRKLDIIEKIKELAGDADKIDKNYDSFKALQAEWKEIGTIPAEHVTETWKNYHHYVEQCYDLLRINHEMRAYDFKKNLEIKTRLCETAEKLAEHDDVISAFHQLQKLHQEFRETGPVAKDIREEIWTRFKTASTLINKRHQDHFLGLKQQEEENLAKKTNLCEQVEALTFEGLTTVAEWDAMAQLIIGLQNEWKTIGFTPRKVNQEIFERFRTACDKFFQAKTAYFRALRESLAENLRKKTALCEKAEALKDSTEWGKTTSMLVKLQAEWKTIGPVAHKVSDAVWTRFNTACNTFFDRKKEAEAGVREEEEANMTKKLDIIARLEKLVAEGSENLLQEVKTLQAEWNETGHVPFRKKEKLYRSYRAACDKLYETIHQDAGRRRLDNLVRKASQSGNERQRLQRAYDEKKAEIQTYETNLTFLTTKSKSGNTLVADIERRIATLKNDLELIAQKMKEIAE
ncbi:DUF349 domain-containing protein [Alloprevotella sp. OH1205_COT-284]|uniref:DUF349 domain-containing protein n=1 Tax=Alloprevotella sp. OH1205_COT-284 TaxID=2491043 RepID=UPI000F5E4383|nr:DUF349 domain-containing protein [Alloprevotella sp. OH1205_COT-284]RRD80386.1 DUF349 domain-containing protein [Alloprevotella sp. OH1205_COT-284]